MKVENYLRMTGLPYQVVTDFNLPKAPKGKMPYIEDAGRVIGDSGLILENLKATYGDPLDAHLSAEERAISLSLIRLMEEHLYWAAGIQPRWLEPTGFKITRSVFFEKLSCPLRHIIPHIAWRNFSNQMWNHGLGRHSRDEIYDMGCADISALADYLGKKPFFTGDKPTTLDAVAYAFIANVILVPFESPIKLHAMSYPNLAAYCGRMNEKFYASEDRCR
jgi:glutathione S-transferase